MEPPPFFSLSEPICRLADPGQPHKLCRRRPESYGPTFICFSCKGNKHLKESFYYYYCATCNLEFHIGCHIILPEIRHPFHPSHPLTLISLKQMLNVSVIHQLRDWNYYDFDIDNEEFHDDSLCLVNHNYGNDDDDDDGVVVSTDGDGNDASLSNGTHSKCKCCRNRLKSVYYHCSICKFSLNPVCSITPPPTTISHLKSHEHTLTLFPVRLPIPCDACGLSLSDTKDFVYACLPCSRMVHRSCIYLPRVIQITRHPHRLSLTPSLIPPGDFACGVCRKTVHVNYGQYSCNKGCHYAVHSKCATRKEVWDGKDLDGVPEEPDEYIEPPFQKIDKETIQHFSHEHYLRLHEKKTICEKDKFCEACTLPIMISQRFYGCMECDFVLDEACASLPRKKYHPLHKHPLTLHPFPCDGFKCSGCLRRGSGFVYKCDEKDCPWFQLDVRCASLPDPLIHGCHPHDLFFNLTRGDCMGCGSDHCSYDFLECIKCNSFLGIRCATLPSEAHYKYDRHQLTICYSEEEEEEDTTRGQYWCEKCESKLDPKTWFYTCESCTITLHVNCLLGIDIYMKPRHTIKIPLTHGDEVEIALSDGNTRLLCSHCNRRCTQTLVFKRIDKYDSFCTTKCMDYFFIALRSNARREERERHDM